MKEFDYHGQINSMRLYRDKIIEYIEIESDKLQDDNIENNPFYMYIPLQTKDMSFCIV